MIKKAIGNIDEDENQANQQSKELPHTDRIDGQNSTEVNLASKPDQAYELQMETFTDGRH